MDAKITEIQNALDRVDAMVFTLIAEVEHEKEKAAAQLLFDPESLKGKTRAQLQKLAKEHGINSRAKSYTIEKNLLLLPREQPEAKEAEVKKADAAAAEAMQEAKELRKTVEVQLENIARMRTTMNRGSVQYDIIHNGGTAYRTFMNESSARVYERSRIDDKFTVLVKEFSTRQGTFRKGFVGKDTSGSGCDGCSILVQMNKNQYTYIGDKIYSFRCEEQILSYYSRMGYPWGNSGEPSPVALTENSVLFMPDRIKVPKVNLRDYVEDRLNGDWGNAYEAFYSEGGRGHLSF